MKPIEDVRDISALTYGFIASKALFAAVELDLFTKIARGADTLSKIAETTGVAANRTRTLLTTLKTVGLISESDGRFANAPATANYLVAGAAGDFRDYVRVVNGGFLYEGLRHLDQALRGQRIFPDKGFYEGILYSEGGVGGAAFSAAQHAGSLGPARLLAKRIDLGGARTLLDVGGGSGAYTLGLPEAEPAAFSDDPRLPRNRLDVDALCRGGRPGRSRTACRGQRDHDAMAGGSGCRADVLSVERGRRE
jgi:2-hydroxy-4-(methylsulfanyl)butanoate S-methyltransferase